MGRLPHGTKAGSLQACPRSVDFARTSLSCWSLTFWAHVVLCRTLTWAHTWRVKLHHLWQAGRLHYWMSTFILMGLVGVGAGTLIMTAPLAEQLGLKRRVWGGQRAAANSSNMLDTPLGFPPAAPPARASSSCASSTRCVPRTKPGLSDPLGDALL